MSPIRRLFLRLLPAFQRRQDHHVTRLFEEESMPVGDATNRARVEATFERTTETSRPQQWLRWLEGVPSDTAYAIRSLRRSPSFTTAAVLTLAIGIGATTAIYSVVDVVLLRPLPFPDGDRLVRVVENYLSLGIPGPTYPDYLAWRQRTTTLSGMAVATINPQVMVPTPQGTVRLTGGLVSSNYFEVLRAEALIGRTLTSADDNDPNVVVLGIHTWRRFFNKDPKAVGSAIELRSPGLSGRLFTIVGVMTEDMETVGSPIDFYTPVVETGGRPIAAGTMIGRLGDETSIAAAREEAMAIGTGVRPPRPAGRPAPEGRRFDIVPYKDDIVGTLRPALSVLLAAVAVVLLIVCANVANLMLARGMARQREIGVRLALGAGRGDIVRQVLTECLIVALVGGALGALLAAGGVTWFKGLATLETEGIFRIVFSSWCQV